MANGFSKEEIVAFEELLAGFDDALVMSEASSRYKASPVELERTDGVIWRPQPYIGLASDVTPGMDSTAKSYTQLSVPVSVSQWKESPWTLNAKELRDSLQEGRIRDAAKQKLSSIINKALLDVATNLGSLVVKRTNAPGTFEDVAAADTIMNQQGVMMGDRHIAFSSATSNGLANDLQKASRSLNNAKSLTALEQAYTGPIAGFQSYKLDYANRIGAAAGTGITMDTTGAFYYVPTATVTSADGLTKNNVDNRFQTITVSSTTGVVVGDCFTVAGIEAAHHITKTSTGSLKTFRVVAIPVAGQLTITPPMITGTGGDAAAEYQNVVLASTSATAALVWLNTAAADINPFWYRDSLEIIPGTLVYPADSGAAVISGTTDQGFQMTMIRQVRGSKSDTFYTVQTLFGVANKQPEMSGILLFNQT